MANLASDSPQYQRGSARWLVVPTSVLAYGIALATIAVGARWRLSASRILECG
jgi:hypothetical protein